MPQPDPPAIASALACLAAVARHHGLVGDARALADAHPDCAEGVAPDRLAAVARDAGLRARVVEGAGWRELARLGRAVPAIGFRPAGGAFILSAVDAEGGRVAVLDPAKAGAGIAWQERDAFLAGWSGDLLLLRRPWRIADPDQPFGLGWFVPQLLAEAPLLRAVAVAVLALHVLAFAMPVFFQVVVDRVFVHQTSSTLVALTVGVALAVTFEAGFGWLRNHLLLYATTRIDVRLSDRVFAHLLRLPVEVFQATATGVLAKHVQQIESIREFLTGRLLLTLLEATALLVVLPLLFAYSALLGLLVLGFALLTAGIVLVLSGPFRRRLQALYAADGERQAMLVESLHGMATIKALTAEPARHRAWTRSVAFAAATRFDVARISFLARALTGWLEKLMFIALIGAGASLVFANELTVGALVAVHMLAGRVTGPLAQLVGLVHEYQETLLSVRMLGEVMNRRPERAGRSGGLRPALAGGIRFREVGFRYPGEARPALAGLSFEAPPGTILGLVGRSGSGKTTVTRLLQGLYAPGEGVVTIDGHDLRELDLGHYRRHVGVVLQESVLLRGTVRENIAAARPDCPFEDVARAARLAGAEGFVQELPRGYDTLLEEGATNLSGGQRQRLSIARALLADPRILILDEATSALDPESEAIVQRNLLGIAAGRTLVIVSHRLATLRPAHRILVLDRGRAEAMGTHEELLSGSATYARLWRQQHGGAA